MSKLQSLVKIKKNNIAEIYYISSPSLVRDINKFLTITKNHNIGRLQNQEYIITSDEKVMIDKGIEVIRIINNYEINGYRNNLDSKKLFSVITECLLQEKPLSLVLILCPFYKKGKREYGFKESVGNTTISLIDFIEKLCIELKPFINVKAEIWFSDLLIENYEKMERNYVDESLNRNFIQIRNLVREKNFPIQVLKLSEIDNLKNEIGLEGKRESNKLPKNIFDRIVNRSSYFYNHNLGWSSEMVVHRMRVLIDSYEKIGKAVLGRENALMIFGEKNLERGRMYSGDQSYENTVPILYPKI